VIVGLNLLYMLPGLVGGTETYAAGLLAGFSRLSTDARFLVYCNLESRDWALPNDERFTRVVCPVRASRRAARYWYEQQHLPGQAQVDGIDLMHSLGYVAPLKLNRPSVLTVPDVHHLAYGTLASWPRRRVLGWFVDRSVHRAAAVIAISRFSRDAVARAYHLPPESIDVVLLAPKTRAAAVGVPTTPVPAAVRDAGPYLIAFGGRAPNKNLPRLLDAFAIARSRYGLDHHLVLVGRLPPSLSTDLEGVVVTGYLDDNALDSVLRGADALLFPSVYEGFGLPVLEAMAAGVPVACSNAAALPEIAGDAALYFPPDDLEKMASSVAEISRDRALRAGLRELGRKRADLFSWEKAARETLAIYRRVLS
jgi:glycosyltransferase involved in cell wall biosynthesis